MFPGSVCAVPGKYLVKVIQKKKMLYIYISHLIILLGTLNVCEMYVPDMAENCDSGCIFPPLGSLLFSEGSQRSVGSREEGD